MIDFPASPTVGQTFISGGSQWTWDGTKWAASGVVGANLVPAINPSRIINGDMGRDQRNNGASGTATGYTVDRWVYGATQASKGSWQRATSGPAFSGGSGFGYNLAFTSSSAYASLPSDIFRFTQPVEADVVTDFMWGTATAQPVTLSFWACATVVTGIFSGAIRNYASTRSYPFTFSLPVSSNWYKIVITIPSDTAGTWVLQGNGGGLTVDFDLGCGSTFRAAPGAWTNGNFVGATGAQSVVSTNGAQFQITGVKLEIGTVATPFNRQSPAKSLADCQRYFEMSYDIGTVPGAIIANGATLWRCITADPFTTGTSFFKVAKRATPTVTIYSPNTGASGKIYAVNPSTDQPAYLPNGAGTTAFAAGINNSSVSSTSVTHHWTASAEL